MALLKAEHITKIYGQRTIIKDINIELNQGELVCLLGVSGSGKTTLFHILSGLTTPEEGHVYLNDKEITSTPGQISYMLQKDLLLPHKKIIDNVSLPLSGDKCLLISLCHSRSFKHRLLYRKISSVDISLIWQIVRHEHAFSFEPAVELVSSDRDIFGSCQFCHSVHVDEIIGICNLIRKLH